MIKDEALKLALEALEGYVNVVVSVNDPNEWTPKVADAGEPARKAITAIKEALAQPEHGWTPERIAGMARLKEAQDKKLAQLEPVKIAHKHEWFRTGEMKVGQMRCISCGTWGQEEMPQRTWVGLTEDEAFACQGRDYFETYKAIEAKLKERNT